ncbi:MAG: lamin tail domain-containing protein, partial [Macellibacteroides sp.]
PGFQNTQYGVIKDGPQTSIEIPVFSPENNCWNLAYHTDQSGYSCRIMVFDPAGRQVAILKNHELIGQKGSLFWDGKGNGGKKLSAGLYILYAEIYHPSGVIYRSKKAFSYF